MSDSDFQVLVLVVRADHAEAEVAFVVRREFFQRIGFLMLPPPVVLVARLHGDRCHSFGRHDKAGGGAAD